MKLIKNDGTLIGEFSDEAAVVIYDTDGASIYTPDGEDHAQAPMHVIMASAAAGFSMTEPGSVALLEWFEQQLKAAREEP